MRIVLFLIILAFHFPLYAQIDYSLIEHKELQPIHIDTISEKIVVIEKRYAIIYLRLSDIKSHIEGKHGWNNKLLNLRKLVLTDSTKYVLKDWWYDYDDRERIELFGNRNYKNPDKKYLDELHYMGADLIHNGKFMIRRKGEDKMISNGLYMKRKDGLYGTEYIDFLLPDEKVFWSIVTLLGE